MKKNLNLIIAAIFMMGFLMFWESFVMSRYNTAPKRPVATVVDSAPVERGKLSSSELTALTAGTIGKTNSQEETLTLLQTANTKVSILSKGARVASWQVQERDHWIELVMPEKLRSVSPLQTFPEVNFSVTKLSDTEASFVGVLPNGVLVKKDLRLFSKPPFHTVAISFTNPRESAQEVAEFLPLGNGVDKHEVGRPYDEKDKSGVGAEIRSFGLAAQVKSWKPGFIFGRYVDMVDNDRFRLVGVDNNHFMMALLPMEGFLTGVKVVADRVHPPMIALPLNFVLQPGQTIKNEFNLFMGAKDYSELQKVGFGLDKSVDFGFFGLIAKFLLKSLNFFDSMTGNYGWAIIILTFCIQIVVFPLTRKNLQHSTKMRDLQPQIKKLQELYKGDPKRLQVETFNLYKKNGMKLMGMEGCFPMLLQIPVFFAFYVTLRVAYELRGAPWIFWIKDLGVADPFYVLPVLMGVGMFFQQKMTAMPADPAQAKIMMFMPVIMTFMFFSLPAGLVLYWCVNSLATIVLQKLMTPPKKIPLQLAP